MNERKNITQPADWWAVWEMAATAAGQDLSTWIGEQCNRSLTKKTLAKLSVRGKRGRPWPKKEDDLVPRTLPYNGGAMKERHS